MEEEWKKKAGEIENEERISLKERKKLEREEEREKWYEKEQEEVQIRWVRGLIPQ